MEKAACKGALSLWSFLMIVISRFSKGNYNKSILLVWHSSTDEKRSNEIPTNWHEGPFFTSWFTQVYRKHTGVLLFTAKEGRSIIQQFFWNEHNISNRQALELKKLIAEQGKIFYKRNTLLLIWLLLVFLLRRAFSWLTAELTCHLVAVSPSPSSRGQSCLPAPSAPSAQSAPGCARSVQWDSGSHKLPTGSQLVGRVKDHLFI